MTRRSAFRVTPLIVVAAMLWMPAASSARSALEGGTKLRSAAVHPGLMLSHRQVPKLTVGANALVARLITKSSAVGMGTRFVCSPAAVPPTNTVMEQSCTISGSVGLCVERSSNPAVVQTCTFTQANTSRSNVAIALQVIEQRDAVQAGARTQTGKQIVNSNQGNVTGSNFTWTTQIVKQFLGRGATNPDSEESQQQQLQAQAAAQGMPAQFSSLLQNLEGTETAQENVDPVVLPAATTQPVSQAQTSQQTISVCQGSVSDCHSSAGMTGNNVNGSYQSLRQWEWANNAPSIDQTQNLGGGDCSDSSSSSLNMCSVVSQSTTGGKNLSGVWELYRQFQRALHTSDGEQVQDSPFEGGLGHDIFQTSVGSLTSPQREWIATGQRARQVQRADDAGLLVQTQDPHADKGPGSFQAGSSADTWNGTLTADQRQLSNGLPASSGTQQQTLTYEGTSTGEIVASVRGTQNGSSASADCFPGDGSPDSCHVGVQCFSATEGPGGCETFTPGSDLRIRRP